MNRQKIDIHNSVEKYCRIKERLKSDLALSQKNREVILQFLDAAELGKTLPYRQKKRISERACLRYAYDLTTIFRVLKKDVDTVTTKNIEDFIKGLKSNTVHKKNGMPYSPQTKRDFNIILKKFYKWYKGDNKVCPDLVNWLDTSYVPSNYTALTEKQITDIIKAAENTTDKAIIALLFDLGTRIEEFLNIHYSDIKKTEKGYKIHILFSKTFERTLPLDKSIRYLEEWLTLRPQDIPYLFSFSYNQCLNKLKRFGKQAIGISITPQIIRHSKATQLAQAGVGRYQMCEWMGWAMSSKMPDRYIRREGIDNQKTLDMIKQRER